VINQIRSHWLRLFVCSLFGLFLAGSPAGAGPRAKSGQTALDRYVFEPDPNFAFTLVNSQKGKNFAAYILEMTSQQWRRSAEVDRPLWKHWLTIVKPEQVVTSTGLLIISGGSNGRPAPASASLALVTIASGTRSVVAELRMVPNEPLTFKDESRSRTEDAIIAYTWDKFIKTGDETWPLRLPMTKSAVRAMDVVTAFCGSAEQGGLRVDKFVVAGGSKRGWTTWTTAAVDDRVTAILPSSIDVLNVGKSLDHHYRAYGFWAPALDDYTEMGLMRSMETAAFKALMKIEDPYSYRDRLTMPKFIVNSAGDQYFVPDSSQFYFNDLKGEKYLRYVPNTKHDLNNSDAIPVLVSFYAAILSGAPRPRFHWKFERDGAISVMTKDRPSEVKLWQATNPKARDFRLDTIGPAYKGSTLSSEKGGVYVGRVSVPSSGWTAYFVELTYPGPEKTPLKFTTGVRILPDTYPPKH
jgi:PhoPQ-activated pathogenicity-related protein